MKKGLCGYYDIECIGADGQVRWSEKNVENAVYDEGEQLILDLALRAATTVTWYIGLLRDSLAAAPAETVTLTTLPVSPNEPVNATSPGYSARGTVLRDGTASGWPTLALDSGDYMATSKTVSWTASGDWLSPIKWMFLTTASATPQDTTGKVVSIAQLSANRTVLNGDTLNVTYKLKLQ